MFRDTPAERMTIANPVPAGYNFSINRREGMSMAVPVPYYLIRLDPPPYEVRSYANRAEQYAWKLGGSTPNRCEISFLQEGSLHENSDGTEFFYPQGTVLCSVNDRVRCFQCRDDVFHDFYLRFLTSSQPVPIAEEEVANWFSGRNQAILPDHVTDPAVCQQIAARLKPTIGQFRSDDVARGLAMRACLYDCLAILTRYAVARAKSKQQQLLKQRSVYTVRACAYIGEHLQERIRMEDVAAYACVSYTHLKTLFLRDMNMTILDYINRSKIRLVEKYITVDRMTLEQAGAAVGLPTPKHLSRLFHRYTGMTVQQYRRIYGEHTKTSSNQPG